MSQKVHPKGFRLRSTGNLGLHDTNKASRGVPNETLQPGTWDSVWFSEPKKGKHFYTRILHEDQLIQDYTKGFFRSFGFYQQKCVIERKCNKELHITSYVLRTPKLQPSKIDLLGTRTRQEKVLQEGLQQGWIPFLIKSIISKILYDKSQNNKDNGKNLTRSLTKSTIFDLHAWSSPSILPILTPQENSLIKVLTNQKRFHDLWNSWLVSNIKGVNTNVTRSSDPKGSPERVVFKPKELNSASTSNGWWTHRSWKSTIYHPTMNQKISNAALDGYPEQNTSWGLRPQPDIKISNFNLTYSIRPAASLTSSSQLIVDYIADKIEQSVSIQQLFNELLRFFETEALCLGPAFISQTTPSESNIKDQKGESNNKSLSNPYAAPNMAAAEDGNWNTSGSRHDSDRKPKVSNLQNWTDMIDERMPVSQTEHQGKALNSSATSDSDLSRTSQRPKILGFRIICSGRLQISSFSKPAEKAESIEITRGVLPLNSFKANIDFAQTYATNAYGTCGIKVWVNRG